MEGKRLIRQLSLWDFLSYGTKGVTIELLPLNVLIGPNASGKSNLIEALAVLRAATTDLSAWVREGGGIGEYIRKSESPASVAAIEAVVEAAAGLNRDRPLQYGLALSQVQHRLQVQEEAVQHRVGDAGELEVLYAFGRGPAIIRQRTSSGDGRTETVEREIRREDLWVDRSILSQRRDPDLYPELTYLADQFASIAIFQEWTFGRRTRVRIPQPADLPTHFLLPDASNLALVLHDMMQRSQTRKVLEEYLHRFYESAQHIATSIYGGTVQLQIEETGGELIPANRLSDGTLRYLSLLAILCHPSPPPLVCIEEPELGLHADILPTIAELLRDASQRTQLVVTTHCDALVSALSEVPESIVVCETGRDGTQLRRLDREALAEWLDRYSLGELWRMGEIGGTRW